jgi:hypothetical protein
LLEYYLPGVNHAQLNDDDYIKKIGHLMHIRKMEASATQTQDE